MIRGHLDMKRVMVLRMRMRVRVRVRVVQFVQALVKDDLVAHLAPGDRASQDVLLSVVLGERGLAAETV